MTPQKLLLDLVSIPSLSGEEGAVADYIAQWATAWSFPWQRSGNNVWFELGRGQKRLLLTSHLDTVPPCAGWEGNPHAPVWKEGKLTGLGANDAKGCVASLLMAAYKLQEETLPGRLVFAFVAEEEIGGAGGISSLLPQLGPLDAAVVGEPTRLQPCIAERGILLLECKAKGESAHVAHASLGENAIHKAARDILKLSGITFPPHELLGTTRPQVTLVQGGLAANQVPDACTFTLDLRTTPNLDHNWLLEQLSGELESEVKMINGYCLPRSTPATAPIAKAALAASGCNAFVGSHTSSDWSFLGEIPTVKVGPGDTFRSHRPNEFLLGSELEAGIDYYIKTAKGYLALAGIEA